MIEKTSRSIPAELVAVLGSSCGCSSQSYYAHQITFTNTVRAQIVISSFLLGVYALVALIYRQLFPQACDSDSLVQVFVRVLISEVVCTF